MSTFQIPSISQAAAVRRWAAAMASPELLSDLSEAFVAAPEIPLGTAEARNRVNDLHVWIDDGMMEARKRRICPRFVDREVSLAEAVSAFCEPVLPGEWRFVPVSTIGNDPHPGLMDPMQNLKFRFLHDWLHAIVGADATFEGELALTLAHTLSGPQSLAAVFASEVAGQAAVAISSGSFPEQRLSSGCWPILREALSKVD